MRPAALFFLFAVVGFAADQHVIPPRDSAGEYPVHAERPMTAIGAELLTAEQVHASFSSELNRAYLVVEVGFFPGEKTEVNLLDFSLVPAGTQTVLRPVRSNVIASVLQKPADTRKPSAPGDVNVYPTVGIGYETGPSYDPVTGRRRAGGWNTSAGVGVGVGGAGGQGAPPPASTGADRRTMETELSEKSLPEGPTARAVAGYLYFPFPGKKKDLAYDLVYTHQGEKIVLPLGKYSTK